MFLAQSILLAFLTIVGMVVMAVAVGGVLNSSGNMEIPYLLILAALGAMIATTGLSAFMIVSAIRNPYRL